MAEEKHIVVFQRPWGVYNSGEQAGFSPAKAAELIAMKYAKPYGERTVKKETAKADEAMAKADEERFAELGAKLVTDTKPKRRGRPPRSSG